MSAARIAEILAASRWHRDALVALALAGPPGAWIGAGFVRNAVWDSLSGRQPDVSGLDDLDVVHLGPAAPDAGFETALRGCRPLPWSVTEQGAMAARHGHAAYPDLATALAHWPETATAIAVRLAAGRLEVMAPHGVGDLLGLVVRPTPAHAAEPAAVRRRVAAKGWQARWPGLRVIGA